MKVHKRDGWSSYLCVWRTKCLLFAEPKSTSHWWRNVTCKTCLRKRPKQRGGER